ncbi:MAG: ascorbate-dependent monooxygenase [Gemmataceae bacterium]|nr:ascorbate-dependent monooxygenase [Gemmataceae bacterium]
MRGFLFTLLLFLAPVHSWADEPVTYSKHIAPILWKNCAGCHRPGEIGPFSLLTYKDAAKRAKFLSSVTEERTMPPWKAERGYGEFADARHLTDAEIKLIGQWAKAGAPEGNPKDLPPAPKFTEGWQLGTPDLIVKMSESFKVPAGGGDIYQIFVIPIPLDSDRTVSAVEFRPGNTSVVHHAIFYLDTTGAARKRAAAEKSSSYRTFGGPGVLVTGSLGGWVPGAIPRHLPDGIGRLLKKNTDLLMQVHYHPNGKPESDQSQLGIHFTKKPVEKLAISVGLNNPNIDIPPGEKRYQRTAQSAPMPVDVNLLSVAPHMHYLGREMKAWAELPGGRTTPLVWIKDWDFNWQGQYAFQKPLTLPKGSVIKIVAYYDNSADNHFNPSNPPQRVRFGEATTDEMCLLIYSLFPSRAEDMLTLMQTPGFQPKADLEGAHSAADIPTEKLVPPGGVPIPEKFKEFLQAYDTNKDGKLTAVEIDAMPVLLRNKVKDAIKQQLDKKADPSKK